MLGQGPLQQKSGALRDVQALVDVVQVLEWLEVCEFGAQMLYFAYLAVVELGALGFQMLEVLDLALQLGLD